MVVCNDTRAYIEFIKEKRGIHKLKKLREQYTVDGGGKHFKFSVNLIEEAPKYAKNRSGAARKLKDSKEKPVAKKRFKDSSVKGTYLLAIVEDIPETRENVKIVLDRLGLGAIKLEDCIASDYKLINLIIGIQGHSSSCPCPYCEWKKKDQFNGKARDRTFGLIR